MKGSDPAFARPALLYPNHAVVHPKQDGIDTRTYIATQLLSGILASGRVSDLHLAHKDAVRHADLLITELTK